MLPTPATPFWSSRKDFSGAVRPAAISPSDSGVKASQRGLMPSREGKRAADAPSVSRKAPPKPRRSPALPLVQPHPLRGVELFLALDQDQVAGHAQVHDQGLRPVEPQQQVLAAPPQPLDRPPGHPRPQLGGRLRAAPAGVEPREPLD